LLNIKEEIKDRYRKYLNNLTVKRLNILMPVAVALLIFLILSDIYIRKSIIAVYTRLLPFGLALFLYICNKFKPQASNYKTNLYNIFLALLPVMMFVKYFIHYGDHSEDINTLSIIVSVFIITLEVRTNLFNSIIIFFLPPLIFFISVFLFLPFAHKDFIPLINIGILIIVGFFINLFQNKLRYRTFLSSYLLESEKEKLEAALSELNKYKDKLEEKVTEKTIDLKQALDKAKESDLLKTQFLLNISHELRTPVNAILGFGDILAQKDNQYEKETKIINQNIKELLDKIENILLLSKLQTEQSGLEISKFKLSEINNKIKDYTVQKIEETGKNIELIFDNNIEEETILNSDFNKIFEILKQLIENAIKYSESGHIKISITEINSKQIKYTVSDTGLGIPPEDLPHIFEIFRKSENKNKLFGGTGIGLSIAKKLTELLNGNIEINSIPGKGTTAVLISDKNIKQYHNTLNNFDKQENELQNRNIE